MITATPPQMAQNQEEFAQLLEIYRARRPRRVLEVGTHLGGTLYHWLKEGRAEGEGGGDQDTPEFLMVVIDYDPAVRAIVEQLAEDLNRPNTIFIQGDSTSPATVERARAYGPYDWVFLDADHHDAHVHSDWLNYGERLTAPGAVVALHDITPTWDPTVEVEHLWREIKAEHDTIEIMIEPSRYGIGVVLLNGDEKSPVNRRFLGRQMPP